MNVEANAIYRLRHEWRALVRFKRGLILYYIAVEYAFSGRASNGLMLKTLEDPPSLRNVKL